jgi:4-hydroxy-2-oxoheptanedioate aldolase
VLGVTETERTAARGFASDSRGVWCQDATPAAAARLARAGFDWLAIDLQHGRHGRSELIGLALDVGARAVIVPQIESAEQASAAVDATFYPPKGRRSSGQMQRIWGAPELTESAANEQIVCAVMIESATALDLVDEIAAVPGLGGLFVGPYDLSLGIGTRVPDLLADTSSDSPLRRIAKAAADHGLLVGAFAGNPAHARLFADHGITCIAVATDGWILQTGAAAALAAEATA